MAVQNLKNILLFLFTLYTTSSLYAQADKTTIKPLHISLKDGNTIDGKLVTRQGDTIVIESATGRLVNLAIKNIKSIEVLYNEHLKDGQHWFENTRMPLVHSAPKSFPTYQRDGKYGTLYQLVYHVGYKRIGQLPIETGELLALFGRRSEKQPFSNETQAFLFIYINPEYFHSASKRLAISANIHSKQLYRIGESIGFNGSNYTATLGNFNVRKATAVIAAPFGATTIGNYGKSLTWESATCRMSNTPDKLSVVSLHGQMHLLKDISLVTENYNFSSEFDNSSFVGNTRLVFMHNQFAINTGISYWMNNQNIAWERSPTLEVSMLLGRKKLQPFFNYYLF
jgi:hypothetical protein